MFTLIGATSQGIIYVIKVFIVLTVDLINLSL